MKLHELLEQLYLNDIDAYVEDRFGDEITHVKVRVLDGRRTVRLETDAPNYKRDLEECEQRCDDAAASFEKMSYVLDQVTKTIDDLKAAL